MMRWLVCVTVICLATLTLWRCRSCTALSAHPAHHWYGSEYDRYCFAQCHADEALRPLRCWGFV